MTRPVQIKAKPRRTKCRVCGAQITRLYTGHGRSIDIDCHGSSAIDAVVHQCSPQNRPSLRRR